MIRGLLEYAMASKTAPAAAVTDMNAVLRTVLQDLHIPIEETGARVTADALPKIAADETGMRQVLQNLISNAIKYRGEPRPEIHVGVKSAPGEWTFLVRDNGIGLDMKYADQIFGLFERLDNDRSGTGIGLAVSRAIVERRGGRMWVESEPGKGAAFYFSLPMRAKAERGSFS